MNGYHNVLFNTIFDTDDGHGERVGLYICNTCTYSKREDVSVFIPHVFESTFSELQTTKRKPIIVGYYIVQKLIHGKIFIFVLHEQ